MKKNSRNVFTIFALALLAITVVTIGRFVSSQKSEEVAIATAIEEAEKIEEEPIVNDIGIPFTNIALAKKQLYTLFVDLRPIDLYNDNHILGSVHIEKFVPDQYANVKNLIFITEGSPDDSTDGNLLTLIEKMPERFETTVLDGGFSVWLDAGIPTIKSGNPDSPSDLAKIHPIEPRDVVPLLDSEDIFILDTRPASSFSRSRIPGAVNIPFDEIERRKREIPASKTVYVYDTDFTQNFYASVLLFDLGYIDAYTITNGFTAWQEFEYPTES